MNTTNNLRLVPASDSKPITSGYIDFESVDSVKIVRGHERFWVWVIDVNGEGQVTGTVNNILIGTHDHGLSYGDEITFHESEILDVS